MTLEQLNPGMIVVYALMVANLILSGYNAGRSKTSSVFWAAFISVLINIALLAWSHGWHLTWAAR